jgi:hypothetical protein
MERASPEPLNEVPYGTAAFVTHRPRTSGEMLLDTVSACFVRKTVFKTNVFK